ncbi:MAG: SGNH/GDSL hydrolase family protein [Verrucomicrobia bacterium]|nr:SGNH/GDSL hydrolase family protein [Verrucomicrobiota bacterium]
MKLLRRSFLGLALLLSAAGAVAQTPAPKKKAPDPAYAPVTDVAGLPRVLLLGDSISIGYTLPVRVRLAGKANVHRPAENCGDTARGVKSLDKWLGDGRWDVIHFNFGLHDLKYLDAAGKYVPPDQGKQVASVADYERNLRELVARLKKTGATLVFATTTPVPAGTLGRVEHDEIRYNEAAVRMMKETGVVVDDLHALVVSRQSAVQLPKNVHFTKDGYEQLADAVVASLAPLLPKTAK